MILIRRAYEEMMFTWNHEIELPEKLPVAFTNKMTVNSLNRKTDIVDIGRMSFDFFNGYTPCCVFKEYCL